jgi:DNA-binding response OmpR family regulator
MEEVWGTQYLGDRRTLHVHIHWLRNALEELEVPFHIETVRGKGYRLVSPPGEHKPEI